MTKTFKMTREQALAVAAKTQDAYSCDRYKSWDACALALRNYTPEQAEGILRSKLMRWAGDTSSHAPGRCTSSDLLRWMADPVNADLVTEEAINELIIKD